MLSTITGYRMRRERKLRTGDLVTFAHSWIPVGLWSDVSDREARHLGELSPEDVCMVIAIEGGDVLVLTPIGAGWAHLERAKRV